MKVVPEPNIMSDCIKAFLGDPQWPEYIKNPQLKDKSKLKLRKTKNKHEP